MYLPLFSDASSTKSKKKSKENPFSFKKFLDQSEQRSSSQQRTSPDVHLGGASGSLRSGHSASLLTFSQDSSIPQHAGGPPDFASDLPDFIQNHFDGPRLDDDDGRLPDFTVPPKPSPARRGEGGGGLPLLPSGNEENLDATFSDEEESGGAVGRTQSLSLPDFIVDSAAVPGTPNTAVVNQDARLAADPSKSKIPELPPLEDYAHSTRMRNSSNGSVDGATVERVSLCRVNLHLLL
jgi:hypothetical protein